VIGLASRLGMDIVLAHPQGYDLIPDVVELTKKQAGASKDMPQALYMHCLPADLLESLVSRATPRVFGR